MQRWKFTDSSLGFSLLSDSVHSIDSIINFGKLLIINYYFSFIEKQISLVVYLCWAYIPDAILESYGFTYFPNRYWSYALPIYLVVVLAFVVIIYFAINLRDTEPLDSFYTLVDEKTVSSPPSTSTDSRRGTELPTIHDIPISVVNRALFSRRNEQRDDEEHHNYSTNWKF